MAFDVKLTGYAQRNEAVLLKMEPGWWDARELMRDSRFVKSINDGYEDYDARLTVEETKALHVRYRAKAGDDGLGYIHKDGRLAPKSSQNSTYRSY